MGTITARRRGDGTVGYTAQIRIKRGGVVVHSEAQTFDRQAAAKAWLAMRTAALNQPGALAAALQPDPTLREIIDKYTADTRRAHGKTKAQVLATIAAGPLGGMRASAIDSRHIVAYAQSLPVQPQTTGNYMAHLAAVFAVARPAWGYPLDRQAMDDARTVLARLGAVAKSQQRTRRPTLPELDALMQHYADLQQRRPDALPMQRLILFAIFSTRRQEEITRLDWADVDLQHAEAWVRDMKHPGQKAGNDVRVTLPPRALALMLQQAPTEAQRTGRVWPHNGDSISASFTRACHVLGIDDLHFHDLRHEGVSLLFEGGATIPQAAAVSGHRSWSSLKRYTHLRQAGDKFAGWAWLARMGLE